MKKTKKSKVKSTYPFELKLRAVRLHFEEGYSFKFIAEQVGAHASTIGGWAKIYEEEGEAGLKPKYKGRVRPKVPPEVKEKIVEIKKDYPIFGVQKISDLLKRIFFMKASPETVRKTLHDQELIKAPKRKARKNPQKPRRFERSRPNQMWQTDIFCFRLGGQNAYLLGFIDDYSRYIIGLGLYRKQTAENLLEVYRQATGEFNCPAEMLTDNGRQYTNWRGTTRFEKELKKDRVKHFRSQPHHPQTLGKIERFWKTIWTEFLDRCQFDSMETARERIALWVKYYNHRRPHQGIDGLCPADRFYEISNDLRKFIERGIDENVLEHALKGKHQQPFYMVGRMNGQSVTLTAEKGQVKMSVDGEEHKEDFLSQLKENDDVTASEEQSSEEFPNEENSQKYNSPSILSSTEMPSSFEPLDRVLNSEQDLSGSTSELFESPTLGETRHSSDATVLGAEEESQSDLQLESSFGEIARTRDETEARRSSQTASEGIDSDSKQVNRTEGLGNRTGNEKEGLLKLFSDLLQNSTTQESPSAFTEDLPAKTTALPQKENEHAQLPVQARSEEATQCDRNHEDDFPSSNRTTNSDASLQGLRYIEGELLQLREQSPESYGRLLRAWQAWSSCEGSGFGERGAEGANSRPSEATDVGGTISRTPE